MKKSVIFLIAILYVVSIVVVTFFGMQISVDQFQIYMTNIEITKYDGIQNGTKYYFFTFNEEDSDQNSLFIDWTTGPDNASHPEKITFSLTNNTYTDPEGNVTTFAEVHANGEIVFYAKRTIRVIISTTDGSSLSDSMTIFCL